MKKIKLMIFIIACSQIYGKGIDINNFYLEVPQENSYKMYGEYEKRPDAVFYKIKIGEGTLKLNEKWDFDYDIEKKFERERKLPTRKVNLHGWESNLGLYRGFDYFKIGKSQWSSDLGVLWKYEQSTVPDEWGTDYQKNKYSLKYRMRNYFPLKKGSVYWGFDFLGSGVTAKERDGYSIEANIIGAANLGYGFQNYGTIYNEYLHYGNTMDTYLLRVEDTLRWTYELSQNWAISVELYIDSYNYYNDTTLDYSFQFISAPYFLYNKELKSDLRFFMKIGLPGYKYDRAKTAYNKEKSSGLYMETQVGIQYIW